MEAAVILFILVIVILFTASPFMGATQAWEIGVADSKLNRLYAAKDNYYKAIKDVEFEYAEGKLSEKDYNELRWYYKEKAVATIKEIERLESFRPSEHEKEKTQKRGKKAHR